MHCASGCPMVDSLDAARASLHAQACERGVPGYLDPQSGLYVLSTNYLKERGFCCGNGCRHCPFVGTPLEHPSRVGRTPRGPK